MQIDRTRFFDGYRAAFGTLKPSQQAGLDALLTAAEGDPQITDLRWLAYMLATVKHECADTWRPIEEFGKGKGRKYGVQVTVTDPAGTSFTNVYYGRGYVQLTWKDNYETMGKALENRLVYEPSLALDPGVAYRIMSLGMRRGSFTGKKLGDYIAGDRCDYVNARKIINGLDQAERIAGYAMKLEVALRDSVVAAVPGGVPTPVQPASPSTPASGPLFTVASETLNVRSGPGATNPAVAGSPLAAGTVVRGVEDQGGWKKVVAQGSGVTGWVSAKFLRPAAAAPAARAVPAPAEASAASSPAASQSSARALFTVASDTLNVHSGPSTSEPTVEESPLLAGTVVEGGEDQGKWKKVVARGSGVAGWVNAHFLRPRGADAPARPVLFTVTSDTLNVHAGPGTSEPTVEGSPLLAGSVVEGGEDQGKWKKVVAQDSGVTGWVNAHFLQPAVATPA